MFILESHAESEIFAYLYTNLGKFLACYNEILGLMHEILKLLGDLSKFSQLLVCEHRLQRAKLYYQIWNILSEFPTIPTQKNFCGF